jgi:monoamine oxidase
MTYDIIIIGAGASGLMAARELSRKGKKVIILEARDRIGGRVDTIRSNEFSGPVEAGAEFIHGKLPVTFGLMEEAGILPQEVEGKFYFSKNGTFEKENDFIKHSKILEQELKEVKRDMPISEFMKKYMPGDEYKELRNSLRRFVEGYDAADTDLASTLAFRDEWLESEDEQYRVVGGYKSLTDHLGNDCKELGCEIFLNSPVKKITWRKNFVEVSVGRKKYAAKKILVTIPIGMLAGNTKDKLTFDPPIPEKIAAATNIGYGGVIKIVLEFKTRFWEKDSVFAFPSLKAPEAGFIFSDEAVPTWWTQLPSKIPTLTSWISGPNAKKHEHTKDEVILIEALRSLAKIFSVDPKILEKELASWRIFNWLRDPYSCGAYSYATLETKKAKKIMNTPVKDTIYFAGEALSSGIAGTVEGAFTSGRTAASRILRNR